MISDREREVEARIVRSAREHGGKYFLRRRYRGRKPWDEPTELDLEHEACQRLVHQGKAIYLGQSGPGIWLEPSFANG